MNAVEQSFGVFGLVLHFRAPSALGCEKIGCILSALCRRAWAALQFEVQLARSAVSEYRG